MRGLYEIITRDDERLGDYDLGLVVQESKIDGEEREDGYWPDTLLCFSSLGEEDGEMTLIAIKASPNSAETRSAATAFLEYIADSGDFLEFSAVLAFVQTKYYRYTKAAMSALMGEAGGDNAEQAE